MRLLLTGASGFLGHHIVAAANGHFDITGWYQHRQPPPMPAAEQVDITHEETVRAAFNRAAPDLVIHTAAISSIAATEQEPAHAEQVNIEASRVLARLCHGAGVPFVFCSTDLVFDGATGNYAETDVVNPLNAYGRQKGLAEQEVFKANPAALIVRLPLLLGHVPGMAGGIVGELINRNNEGGTAALFTNEYRSIAWAADVAAVLLQAMQEGWQGLYHLGGPEPLSRYQAGLLVQKHYQLNRLHIAPTTHAAAGITNRAALATLNSSKAFSGGYRPHTVEEALCLLTPRAITQ